MPPLSRAIRSGFLLKLGVLQFTASVHSVLLDEDATDLVGLCTGVGEKHSPATIKRTDACSICGNDTRSTFTKGRKVGEGYVTLTETELAEYVSLDRAAGEVIDLHVHPRDAVASTAPAGKMYYLNTAGSASSQYALIVRLLQSLPDLAFVAEFSVKGVAALYELKVMSGALVLSQLARPGSVRDAPQVAGEVNDADFEMARLYAERIVAPFDPAAYGSRRATFLASVLDGRQPSESAASADGMDLQSKLRQELDRLAAEKPVARPARKRAAKKVASPAA